MANDKDDKFDDESPSINDSGELLKELFREELNAIAAEKKKLLSAQTGDKSTAAKTAKSPGQDKEAGRKKLGPEIGTETRTIVKNYPVPGDRIAKPWEVAPDEDTPLKNEKEEEPAPGVKGDTPGELIPEEVIETKELKGERLSFGGNLLQASSKLKVALVSVLLVAAVAFMLGSLGIVDYVELLGLTEPPNKGVLKTSVPKRPIPNKSTPSTSTQEPVIAGPPPKPVTSTQKEVVTGEPPEPAPTTQEAPWHKTPAEPVDPTQKPLVAKKPPEPSGPEVQPVVTEAAPRSAEQTPEKASLGKGIVFPGEKDLPYPYSIYHGSYKSRERAERAISEYREKGLSPYWVKIDLGDKGVWYRVFSEYFQKREQADEFIEQKQIAKSESRHTRYANLIGLFAFQEELEEEKVRLSKLGYCPYVIPRGNGEFLLCVGAFYQRERAERQHEELASKGVHSKIVER